MATEALAIDGGELSYELRGAGDPVVRLHGGGLDGRTWDAEVALLEGDHTVIRFDARNHGRSSTASATFSYYDDLRQLLTGLGITRASLVGLSLGARTSIDFALAPAPGTW
ncbi:alpha/beta fold hydrolase [Pseudonocardia sp. TRM90224]|uniref:alpha/beta fold hydrolase n=1 Tax=Pseudonocardia sp. TRM90224 TaxID=2812678 RepID=UPI001E5ED2E6|nr:alpha/beta hydrolase [Pseudonocardia sp. TRM90224]